VETAEILILRPPLAVLQRRQPLHPNLNWADRVLFEENMADALVRDLSGA
jgi:hypothetical protein